MLKKNVVGVHQKSEYLHNAIWYDIH